MNTTATIEFSVFNLVIYYIISLVCSAFLKVFCLVVLVYKSVKQELTRSVSCVVYRVCPSIFQKHYIAHVEVPVAYGQYGAPISSFNFDVIKKMAP